MRLFFFFLPFAIFAHLQNERLPDFLIIGAQKAGTRAFYEILSQHPLIAKRPGEVHFFDILYDQGGDWYKAQFPKTDRSDVLLGDKSPYYLFHPLAPARAFSLVPKAKIIVILRNPIDRAYSQYWMNIRKNQEPLTFSEAVQAEKERLHGEEEQIIATGITPQFSNHRNYSYLSRGCYAEQLMRWLAFYPLEQIMIISNDDLRNDPRKIMNEALLFLNLPEYSDFDFSVGKDHSYPKMDPELRQKLSNYFRPYNEQLETLLQRKFNWD